MGFWGSLFSDKATSICLDPPSTEHLWCDMVCLSHNFEYFTIFGATTAGVSTVDIFHHQHGDLTLR